MWSQAALVELLSMVEVDDMTDHTDIHGTSQLQQLIKSKNGPCASPDAGRHSINQAHGLAMDANLDTPSGGPLR